MLLFTQLESLIESGGFVMPPLLFLAFLLWVALAYRFFMLKRLSRSTLNKIKNPGSLTELLKIYTKSETSLAADKAGILDLVAKHSIEIAKNRKSFDANYLNYYFYPIETGIKKYQTLVNSVVVVAPLLGLLGTVAGMIETFESLSDQSLFSQSGGIAGGIAQALFTTQVGLVIAIPGLIAGRILNKKQDVIADEIDQIKQILLNRPLVDQELKESM